MPKDINRENIPLDGPSYANCETPAHVRYVYLQDRAKKQGIDLVGRYYGQNVRASGAGRLELVDANNRTWATIKVLTTLEPSNDTTHSYYLVNVDGLNGPRQVRTDKNMIDLTRPRNLNTAEEVLQLLEGHVPDRVLYANDTMAEERSELRALMDDISGYQKQLAEIAREKETLEARWVQVTKNMAHAVASLEACDHRILG